MSNPSGDFVSPYPHRRPATIRALRNGLVPGDDATARSDVAFHLVADCKHSVRSVRQYPS